VTDPLTKAARSAIAVALLASACATGSPPLPPVASDRAAPPPAGRITRCSASDPDRDAWYCVLGHIVYAALSMIQTDPGPLR
jgi:hypothetical protein